MRILVAGGTGFLGRAVVMELRARSAPVRVLSRRAAPAHERDVAYVRGDLVEGRLDEAVKDIDAIVYAIGASHEAVVIDPEDVARFFETAARAGVKKLVVASSAYLAIQPELAEESTNFERLAQVEAAALGARGLSASIVRLPWVIGDMTGTDGVIAHLARRAKDGGLALVPQGGANFVSQRMAARALLAALEHDDAQHYLVGDENLSWHDLHVRFRDVAGTSARALLPAGRGAVNVVAWGRDLRNIRERLAKGGISAGLAARMLDETAYFGSEEGRAALGLGAIAGGDLDEGIRMAVASVP